jgi:hypothetical protein
MIRASAAGPVALYSSLTLAYSSGHIDHPSHCANARPAGEITQKTWTLGRFGAYHPKVGRSGACLRFLGARLPFTTSRGTRYSSHHPRDRSPPSRLSLSGICGPVPDPFITENLAPRISHGKSTVLSKT